MWKIPSHSTHCLRFPLTTRMRYLEDRWVMTVQQISVQCCLVQWSVIWTPLWQTQVLFLGMTELYLNISPANFHQQLFRLEDNYTWLCGADLRFSPPRAIHSMSNKLSSRISPHAFPGHQSLPTYWTTCLFAQLTMKSGSNFLKISEPLFNVRWNISSVRKTNGWVLMIIKKPNDLLESHCMIVFSPTLIFPLWCC